MIEIPRSDVCNIFKPGNVIWRPLRQWQGVLHPELSHVTVTPNDPTPFLRTLPDGYGQGICEPVINPYHGPHRSFGIITFVRGNVQECWTHLVIVSVGRGGKNLNAIPECLPDVEAYIKWRLQVDSLYSEREIVGKEPLAARVASYPCPGLRVDRSRVQCFNGDTEGTYLA